MENKNTLGNAFSVSSNSASFNGTEAPRNGKLIAITVVVLLLIFGAVGIVWYVAYSNSQSSVNRQFNNTNVDLNNIATSDFKDSEQLTIIGQLNLDGGLALTPSGTPENSKAGQIYYDQTSNLLSYYNGSEYIQLSGDLQTGTGLAQTDGVLTNSGVLSLQGQTGDVSLTAGNGITISGTTISANGGAGVGGSGTTGRIAKFTGAQTLGNSLLTESGTTISVGGDLNVTGGLSLTTALTVANGGTGATNLTADGVLVGNGSGTITSVTAAGAGLCLQSTAGAPTFAACPGGGGGVTSLNGLSGALTLANSSGVGSTVTIDNATTAAKGIASFNSTNFTVTAGAVNTIQDIATTSSPTFANMTLTGDLAVNGNDITSTGAINLTSGGAGNVVIDPAVDFRVAGGADANTLYVKSSTDSVGVGTNAPNFKLEVNGTLGVSGLASLTSLGAADTGAYLCRNSSNQIATCNTTGTGVAFVQGGNSFGGTAILGTNDANDLAFERNNVTQMTVGNGTITLASDVDLILSGAAAYISNSQGLSNVETFGANANAGSGASNAAAFGANSTVDTQGAAFGASSTAIGGAVAVGYGATADGDGAIAIGHNSNTLGHDDSIVFGNDALAEANNQIVFGSGAHVMNHLVVGNGVTAGAPTGFTLQATSGTGANIAGATTTIAGGGSTGSAFGGSIDFRISAAGVGGSGSNAFATVMSIGGAKGSVGFQNAVDDTQAFHIKSAASNNIFVVDTVNSRAGIALGGGNTPTNLSGAGLEIKGALSLTGSAGSGLWDAYTTPLGSTIESRINIQNDTYGTNGSAIYVGVEAASDATSRGITVLDARASTHQPSMGVISPNETAIGGFTWDGSNSDFRIANSSTVGTLSILTNGVGRGTFGSGGLDVTGGITLTSLGSADTATLLCRNSSNAVASCNTTGTGVAFVNGGNTLGATGTLGTNDGNALAFETNNVTRLSISSTGDITVGTSDTTGSLLVLDTKTSGGDPTGVDGGMYYNSALEVMRCYMDGYWRDCVQNERTAYSFVDDFIKTPSNDTAHDTLTIYGEYFGVGSATYAAGHPGVLNLAVSTNGNKTAMTSGSSFDNSFTFGNGVTWRHETETLIPSLSDGTDRYVYTTGFNVTNDTIASITDGCYFRYSDNVNSGNWEGVCEDGTEATCDTTINVTADQWYRLTLVVNDTATSVDFQVDGVTKCTITTHIPSTTTLLSFESIVNKTAGGALRGAYVDYLSVHAQLSTAR